MNGNGHSIANTVPQKFFRIGFRGLVGVVKLPVLIQFGFRNRTTHASGNANRADKIQFTEFVGIFCKIQNISGGTHQVLSGFVKGLSEFDVTRTMDDMSARFR